MNTSFFLLIVQLNVKVSLAKPIPKNKQSKGGSKSIQDYSKEKLNVVNRESLLSQEKLILYCLCIGLMFMHVL